MTVDELMDKIDYLAIDLHRRGNMRKLINTAIAAAVAEERERCARIANGTIGPLWHVDTAGEIAARIRKG